MKNKSRKAQRSACACKEDHGTVPWPRAVGPAGKDVVSPVKKDQVFLENFGLTYAEYVRSKVELLQTFREVCDPTQESFEFRMSGELGLPKDVMQLILGPAEGGDAEGCSSSGGSSSRRRLVMHKKPILEDIELARQCLAQFQQQNPELQVVETTSALPLWDRVEVELGNKDIADEESRKGKLYVCFPMLIRDKEALVVWWHTHLNNNHRRQTMSDEIAAGGAAVEGGFADALKYVSVFQKMLTFGSATAMFDFNLANFMTFVKDTKTGSVTGYSAQCGYSMFSFLYTRATECPVCLEVPTGFKGISLCQTCQYVYCAACTRKLLGRPCPMCKSTERRFRDTDFA